MRFRLHDDTLRDTVGLYIAGLIPGESRSGKRTFAPEQQPGFVNHRRTGAHVPMKLGYAQEP